MSNSKPDFFEIKESKMIEKILDVTCRHKVIVTVWLKNQSVKFDSLIRYYISGSNRLSIALPPGMSEEQFSDALNDQNSQEVFCSFQLDNVNFFLKTVYAPAKGTSDELIQLEAPKSVFKLQRRADLRIPFPRSAAPKVTTLKPGKTYDTSKPILDSDLYAFRMVDISAGGMGIAAPIELKDALKHGTVLEDMRFTLRGMEIVVRGVVRFGRNALSDQGKVMYRVGVQFVGLKAHYEKHIVQFVLDESRKMFSLLH